MVVGKEPRPENRTLPVRSMACSGMTLAGQGKGLSSLLALSLARGTTFCMRQCSLQKKSKTEPKPAGKTDRCTECACDERMGNQPLEFLVVAKLANSNLGCSKATLDPLPWDTARGVV